MYFIHLIEPIVFKASLIVEKALQLRQVKLSYKDDGSAQTNVDLAVEDFLKRELIGHLPGSTFLAEETGAGQPADYVWVIDPIDGTANMIRGLPHACISVALMQGQAVIAAVIYDLYAHQSWSTQQGFGLFLDRKPYKPYRIDNGDRSFYCAFVTSWLRQQGSEQDMVRLSRCVGKPVTARLYGSIALSLVYVANGSLDLAIMNNPAWWDVAAACLMIEQAGLYYVQKTFTKKGVKEMVLIAGNAELVEQVAQELFIEG